MNKNTVKHIITLVLLAAVSTTAIIFTSKYINVIVREPEPPADVQSSADTDAQTEKVVDDTPIWGDSNEDDPTNETSTLVSKAVLKQTANAGSDYLDQIIFIGDGSLKNFSTYAFTGLSDPHNSVWVADNNTEATQMGLVTDFKYPADGEYHSFIDGVKDTKPPYVILCFGSYSREKLDKEDFRSAFGEFIVSLKNCSPNTDIIIQSILPVPSDCAIIKPKEVKERNSWLIEFCEEFMVYYVDVWSTLCDEDGVLRPEYTGNDKYSMNENGFREMVEYICFHAHPSYSIEQ